MNIRRHEAFGEIYEQWQQKDLSTVVAEMPRPEIINLPDGGQQKVVELSPPSGEYDGRDIGYVLAHAQSWKPSMYIRQRIAQEILFPDSRMLVFGHNNPRDEWYSLNKEKTDMIKDGDFAPLGETIAAALEAKKSTRRQLAGWSLGGIVAVATGRASLDTAHVSDVASLDAPNKTQDKKALRKDFMVDGLASQAKAVRDAELPALRNALSKPRLAWDIGRFGLATLQAANAANELGMTHSRYEDDILQLAQDSPGTVITLARVANSAINDQGRNEDIVERVRAEAGQQNVRSIEITGGQLHGHATADNPRRHAEILGASLSS